MANIGTKNSDKQYLIKDNNYDDINDKQKKIVYWDTKQILQSNIQINNQIILNN